MIHVVDYGRGNLFSIVQALRQFGLEASVSGRPADVERADTIILPGVGAFGDAMAALDGGGLTSPLRSAASRGVPMLGICLGLQLFMESSEEFGHHKGLGLIPGDVRRLSDAGHQDPSAVRIPNVGWRALRWETRDPLRPAAYEQTMFYFVHSYGVVPREPEDWVASLTINGDRIASVVRRGAIVGCQFHPEKSGPAGLAFLRAFFESAMGRRTEGGRVREDA